MRKIIFCIVCSLLMSVSAYGSVVGDGYGTIGGGETAVPSTPSSQPVIVPPEPEPPTVSKKTISKSDKKKEEKEVKEKVYERKKPPAPSRGKEFISESIELEIESETEKDIIPEIKQEDHSEKIDVIVLSLSGNTVIQEDKLFPFEYVWKVLKIGLTIILSYIFVFSGYALLFLPRLYLRDGNAYRFSGFLILHPSDNGYLIRIPKFILAKCEEYVEGKIVFTHSKKIGQVLDIQTNNEVVTYTIEREVIIYIRGGE